MSSKYDLKAIEKALNDGVSYSEISTRYSINRGYISKLAKKYNWEISNKKTEVNTVKHLIDDVAIAKFNQMKDTLGKQVTVIDEPILIILANQYATYIELEKKVKTEGITLYNDKGRPSFINPTYNAMQSVIKTLAAISKEFGLTIASRKRHNINIAGEGKKEKSIFNIDPGDDDFNLEGI